uniref:Uncharacterized protein n=1 Tax=Anguilla anguilla TaxID=7936 RepID=A0A0E9Q9V0_ANGAN
MLQTVLVKQQMGTLTCSYNHIIVSIGCTLW